MTWEMIVLARCAVACEDWRWLPGMLAWRTTQPVVQARGGPCVVPVRFVAGMNEGSVELADPEVVESPRGNTVAAAHSSLDGWHRAEDLHPDFSDPATVGCLLALVRAARGDPHYRPWPLVHDPGLVEWVIEAPSAKRQTIYSTEVAALVAALLAKKDPKEAP